MARIAKGIYEQNINKKQTSAQCEHARCEYRRFKLHLWPRLSKTESDHPLVRWKHLNCETNHTKVLLLADHCRIVAFGIDCVSF